MCRCPKTLEGKLSYDVCCVVIYVMEIVQQTYSHLLPPPSSYPSTNDNDQWRLFPNLPSVRGKRNYAADDNATTRRRLPEGFIWPSHRYTRYFYYILLTRCLLWFQSCESPKHPFDILTYRIQNSP